MTRIAKLLVSLALILMGLTMAVFGNTWGPFLFERLETSAAGTWVTLIVPFLPMVFIGLGATLKASLTPRPQLPGSARRGAPLQ